MRNLLTILFTAGLAVLPATAQRPAGPQNRGGGDLIGDVTAWQTVVDGVMGGLSSGRVQQLDAGVLTFTGELSLENNGGFSQMRRAVDGAAFVGGAGIVLECRGDGRTYNFDIRTSNARVMAGSHQQQFATRDGEWIEVRLPFDGFALYSFGRQVRGAPAVDPAKIESIGVTLSDKRAGSFRLDVRAIRCYGAGDAATTEARGDDLASVAKAAGLNTLLTCLDTAGLSLPDTPVTIFAPTDAAFAALPQETVAELLSPAGRAALTTILTYHVVPGAIASAAVLNARELPTLQGQPLAVDAARGKVGNASLVAVDVPFAGGVVHVIDAVLLPEQRSLAALAAADPRLETLCAAVRAAGLTRQLDGDGPWTVFAPIDAAFAALPEGTLASLLEPANRGRLTEILGLHVVPGRIAARELLAKRQLTSLLGQPIDAALVDGKITVGGAGLVATDIQAKNGVIHLIGAVLLPRAAATAAAAEEASFGGRTIVDRFESVYTAAVARGVPRFNDGDAAGCADIYEIAIVALLECCGDDLPEAARDELRDARKTAEEASTPRLRAWALRRGLDGAALELRRLATPGSAARPGR